MDHKGGASFSKDIESNFESEFSLTLSANSSMVPDFVGLVVAMDALFLDPTEGFRSIENNDSI